MSRIVLVHGAWHGAWCWEHVRPMLTQAGHEVVTPTLTGLAERRDELTAETGLADHVGDVLDALAGERSVLVGHSYAGLLVRQAADQVPELVERIVLVDGWAGLHGASLFDLAPQWFVDGLRQTAATAGQGWWMPVPAPPLVGVTDPDQARWLEENLTVHPLRTFEEQTTLSGAVDDIPGTAIVCRPGGGLPFEAMALNLGYELVDIESGHDAMVLAPRRLADLILDAAT